MASNFAEWFIGIQGTESAILGNFAPPEAQNWTNRLGHTGSDKSHTSLALWWAAIARAMRACTRAICPCVGLACVDIRPSLKMEILVTLNCCLILSRSRYIIISKMT